MLTPDQQKALIQIAEAAVESERATGVPAEISAAQAILESGWLAKAPLNNCFGIKKYPGCQGTQLLETHEYFTPMELVNFLQRGSGRTAHLAVPIRPGHGGRELYDAQDLFATFASLADCFAYHSKLLTIGVYKPAWERYLLEHERVGIERANSLANYIQGIAVHYATAPDYAMQVQRIIIQPNVHDALAAARSKEQTT